MDSPLCDPIISEPFFDSPYVDIAVAAKLFAVSSFFRKFVTSRTYLERLAKVYRFPYNGETFGEMIRIISRVHYTPFSRKYRSVNWLASKRYGDKEYHKRLEKVAPLEDPVADPDDPNDLFLQGYKGNIPSNLSKLQLDKVVYGLIARGNIDIAMSVQKDIDWDVGVGAALYSLDVACIAHSLELYEQTKHQRDPMSMSTTISLLGHISPSVYLTTSVLLDVVALLETEKANKDICQLLFSVVAAHDSVECWILLCDLHPEWIPTYPIRYIEGSHAINIFIHLLTEAAKDMDSFQRFNKQLIVSPSTKEMEKEYELICGAEWPKCYGIPHNKTSTSPAGELLAKAAISFFVNHIPSYK